MKLLLLGANGQVGRECRRALPALGELICATRTGKLDDGTACALADFDQPHTLAELLQQVQPDAVINAAAYTAVDKAESEPEAAFRVNAEAPAIIAQGCKALGIPLIHYSTDYVFAGDASTPYAVDAATAPQGVYGQSKLAGEAAIRDSGCAHSILRTAWVYAAHGKNFLLTMLRLGAEREHLRVVADQIGTPTSAAWIADVTAQLLAQGANQSGTWHLVPDGQTSWHGFAQAIMQGAHARGLLVKLPTVEAISTAEFPTPAKRPAWSVLDNRSLARDWQVAIPDWQQGLDAVLDELKR